MILLLVLLHPQVDGGDNARGNKDGDKEHHRHGDEEDQPDSACIAPAPSPAGRCQNVHAVHCEADATVQCAMDAKGTHPPPFETNPSGHDNTAPRRTRHTSNASPHGWHSLSRR